jgi:hypothetical protein
MTLLCRFTALLLGCMLIYHKLSFSHQFVCFISVIGFVKGAVLGQCRPRLDVRGYDNNALNV